MAWGGKSLQEYPVNAGVPQGPFLVQHFSYYTLMNFLMMSKILQYMPLILLSKCDQAFDLQEQLKLASELKSEHWTGVESGLLI